MLHVSRGVIEEELGRKVVEAWRLWIKFEADQSKGLACNLTDRWERLKGARSVLHDAILNRCVACVVQLHGLVDTLVWTAVGEADLRVAELNHRDEGLRARGK